ncbi:YfhO family protein [uncultured Oscillibacter sp.]|uniref:YfhO family protein n=1 Tax=uncultured Oscillibacter sp. TaxID=876091 RepID=UPI0025CCE0E7|nr:YfhO family protein [uncultured Oscillibacter sp.]
MAWGLLLAGFSYWLGHYQKAARLQLTAADRVGVLHAFCESGWYKAALFLLLLSIPLILYGGYYAADMLPINGDGVQDVSFILFKKRMLAGGEFPLWNSALSNGVPFAGDITAQAFYPLTSILCWLPIKLGFYMNYALHLALGAYFLFCYLEEIGCKRLAATCIAVLYQCSIHLGGMRKNHFVIIRTIIYLPVIFYFVERFIRTRKMKYLFLSSGVMALQFYVAFPQDAFYSAIIVFSYLLALGIHYRMPLKEMLKKGLVWGFSYVGLMMLQLLPTLEMLREYGKMSDGDYPYESFTGLSIHPAKLAQMAYPKLFVGGADNIFESFGAYKSSGFDIELFLGVCMLCLLAFGLWRYWKQSYHVRLGAAIMIGVFAFAACANIPFLGKILYQIPILNSFRVPSRILFVFIFFGFVLAGIALSHLCEEAELRAFTRFLFPFTALVLLCGAAGYTAVQYHRGLRGRDLFAGIFQNLLPEFLLFPAIALALFLWYSLGSRHGLKKGTLYAGAVLILTAVNLWNVLPYTLMTGATPMAEITGEDDPLVAQLNQELGNSKMWEAKSSNAVASTSFLSLNKPMMTGLTSINSYIPFNNPRLYRLMSGQLTAPINFSGLMIALPNAQSLLQSNNSLLNMLGVKFIVDSDGLMGNGSITSDSGKTGEPVLDIPLFTLQDTGAGWAIDGAPIQVESDTYYRITCTVTSSNTPDFLYLDFVGDVSYDNDAQQRNLTASADGTKNSFILNTETIPAGENVVVRVVGSEGCGLTVSALHIEKIEVNEETVYVPYGTTANGVTVYENLNAKDILYVPERVETIADMKAIYFNSASYALDTVSYVEDIDSFDCAPKQTQLEIGAFKNSSISATVTSGVDTFVNFSQNEYPGWNAYVDGEKTACYLVNGTIMGVQVPAGTHTVEFRFEPVSIAVGGGVTALTLAAIAVFLKRQKKHEAAAQVPAQTEN